MRYTAFMRMDGHHSIVHLESWHGLGPFRFVSVERSRRNTSLSFPVCGRKVFADVTATDEIDTPNIQKQLAILNGCDVEDIQLELDSSLTVTVTSVDEPQHPLVRSLGSEISPSDKRMLVSAAEAKAAVPRTRTTGKKARKAAMEHPYPYTDEPAVNRWEEVGR